MPAVPLATLASQVADIAGQDISQALLGASQVIADAAGVRCPEGVRTCAEVGAGIQAVSEAC